MILNRFSLKLRATLGSFSSIFNRGRSLKLFCILKENLSVKNFKTHKLKLLTENNIK